MDQYQPPQAPGAPGAPPPPAGAPGNYPPGPPGPNPYAPPTAPAGPQGGDPAGPVYPYVPAHGFALVAMVLLGCTMALEVGSIIAWLHQYGLLSDVSGGKTVSQATLKESDSLRMILVISAAVLQLITAIPFCIWFHRKHRNLPALGAAGLQYTPGWAAGAFFVPILNLFRPYQIGAEIWNASHPEADPANPWHWKYLAGAPLIATWWAFFLGPGFVDRLVSQRLLESGKLEAYQTGIMISIAVDVAVIVATLVTIHMMRKLNERQELKHARIEQHRQQYPPPQAWPAHTTPHGPGPGY